MAKHVKQQFVKKPIGRRFLIWIGQTQHAFGTRMTIWSSGYKVRHISPIEEGAALSQGADLLSESFVFFVSGSVVVYEYHRSSEKEKVKEEARLKEITDESAELQAKLNSLDKRLVSLEEFAKANRRAIVLGVGIGANGKYVEPGELVPINDKEVEMKTPKLKESSPVMKSPDASQRSRRWWWPF
ncbi:hypothetical protein ACHAW5_005235 [Stephanodiscus triporus]|uniref:OPA3-like protein n=1 Tax=Stephanodiscus triporus TaxID=2934178 RepID=A0ABD3Q2Z3_9STRA